MLFDRLNRSAVSHGPRRSALQPLRIAGLALLLLPFASSHLPIADAAAGNPEPLVALGRPAAVPEPLREATPLGEVPQSTVIKIGISLPWRNSSQLDSLIHSLSDPHDPQYKKYLTHQQFIDRFAPTQTDYDAVKSWATQNGLAVQTTTPSRNLLVVTGPSSAVESAFHVQLDNYRLASGRVVYANAAQPAVASSVGALVSGVVGLTNYTRYVPHYSVKKGLTNAGRQSFAAGRPLQVGSGPGQGLTPADIRSIYNINSLSSAGLDGTGQTIALYEQNGYIPEDITQYAESYGLPDPVAGKTLTNVTIGNYDGIPTDPDTQGEVTLDIEMILAVAPKANIIVYEFDSNTLDTSVSPLVLLTKIANDNLAQIVSMSYGTAEADANFGGELNPENDTFKQMTAQGQTMLASTGDSGAYNVVASDPVAPGTELLSVNDPASQPLVTAVGGTSLKSAPIVGGVATYGTETTWNTSPLPTPEGGGGGESIFWPKPEYQTGLGSSETMRDIPDVSLNADPDTGYSVFIKSQGPLVGAGVTGFTIIGGTSASCPLWAAFMALVNQQRQIFGQPSIGFANADIYTAAQGPNYAKDFHDIADNSTNLVYSAVQGFDDATGWGTFIANNLLPEFAPTTFGSGVITVHVTNMNGFKMPGATVTITTPQIKLFSQQLTADSAGNAVFTVPTGLHNFNNTGQDGTLSYIVTADYTGLAGQVAANVVPTTKLTLQLRTPDHTYPNASIQMISSPLDYSTVGDFASLFGLSLPLSANGSTAQLYSYDPVLQGYRTYPTAPADTLRRGYGYWAVLPNNAYIRRIGVYAPTQTFRINLLAGWNMIGDPFTKSVAIGNIQVDTVSPGAAVAIGAATTVQLPFYSYDGSAYQTVSSGGSLQPYQGYWIHATSPAVLVIPAP